MLSRIDKALLVFAQAVVETTQIRPAKWLRILSHPMLLGTGAEAVLRIRADAPLSSLAMGVIGGLMCAWGTRWLGQSDLLTALYADLDGWGPAWRKTMLVVICLFLVVDVTQQPSVVEYVVSNLVSVCLLVSYYFAACQPPTPRPPKRKAVPSLALPQGGAA